MPRRYPKRRSTGRKRSCAPLSLRDRISVVSGSAHDRGSAADVKGLEAPLKLAFVALALLTVVCPVDADVITFETLGSGVFVPETAPPDWLAAIGGGPPDEFISFEFDVDGNPILADPGPVGSVYSNSVNFRTAASAFGRDEFHSAR